MNKKLFAFVSCLFASVFMAVAANAFNGPPNTVQPGDTSGALQIDPSISSSEWPVLKIDNIGGVGVITTGIWQGAPINTLYGGTGCATSGATALQDLRTCLQAANSGTNTDITSLSPSGNLLLTPGGKVGIGTGSINLTDAAYAGTALLVGQNAASTPAVPFRVNSSGNITRINDVAYSWPATQGAAGTVLTSGTSGALTWSPVSGGTGGGSTANGCTEQSTLNPIYANITSNVGI